jgi:cell division protein FtsZ
MLIGRQIPVVVWGIEGKSLMRGQGELFEKKSTFSVDEGWESSAKIMVIGIGGAGCNSVNRMVEAGIKGMDLVAADTDIRELRKSEAPIRFEIGMNLTRCAGCGGDPQLGRQAALQETENILGLCRGREIVFLIGGEGGGTFTGAAPVFASLASKAGAFTTAIATMPFNLECGGRKTCARIGIRELEEAADALMVIPNEILNYAADENELVENALSYANDILCQAVQTISGVVMEPGKINPKLADVRAILQHREIVLMGSGVAEGPNRATDAPQSAISNPLLEEKSVAGAKFALILITGARQSLKIWEVESVARVIKEGAGVEDTAIGMMHEDGMKDRLKVAVIVTGFSMHASQKPEDCGIDSGTKAAIPGLRPATSPDIARISDSELFWKEMDRPAFGRKRAG